jgi:predicted phosphohydrolase
MKKLIEFICVLLVSSQSWAMDIEKYLQDQKAKTEFKVHIEQARFEREVGLNVKMWTAQKIKHAPHEKGSETIYADNLRGAVVVCLIVQHQSGKRRVMLSNYPPMSIEEQGKKVSHFMEQLKQCDDHIICTHLILAVQENCKYFRYSNKLKQLAHCEPIICTYPQSIIEDQQRTFQVTLHPSKLTWRSFGDWYVEHEIQN